MSFVVSDTRSLVAPRVPPRADSGGSIARLSAP
jgi:hypothetical protein